MIYPTSDSITESIRALDDKRLNRTIITAARLICTAARIKFSALGMSAETEKFIPYANLSNLNDPWSIWTRVSFGNCDWLVTYFTRATVEYETRHNKIHKSWSAMRPLVYSFSAIPDEDTKEAPLTPFPNTTEYKNFPVTEAYRKTLCWIWNSEFVKHSLKQSTYAPLWTACTPPHWYAKPKLTRPLSFYATPKSTPKPH